MIMLAEFRRALGLNMLLPHPTLDVVTELMLQSGVPLTRESWITLAYGGHLPPVWTGEHEDSVPARFRDPSQIGRTYDPPADDQVFPPYCPFGARCADRGPFDISSKS
jgi:hypothetical protein